MTYGIRYTTPTKSLHSVIDEINGAGERIVSVQENGGHEADFGLRKKAFLVVVDIPSGPVYQLLGDKDPKG